MATGVSDEERRVITDRLRPYLADASKTRVPRCYQVTNHPKSRPHMWVTDPTQSIVLQARAASCGRLSSYLWWAGGGLACLYL